MIEIRNCDDYEAARELIREYSQIKGAESCFVSLDRELADLPSYYVYNFYPALISVKLENSIFLMESGLSIYLHV